MDLKTKNADAKDLYRDIQEKRMKKETVDADPHADPKQKEQAKQDFSEAIEKALEFDYTGKDPLDNPAKPPKNVRDKIDNELEKIEQKFTEKGEIGKAKRAIAKQDKQNAARMQKGADKLRQELTCNPNAQEITVNTRNGPLKFTREEALQRMHALEGKAANLKASAKINSKEGLSQAPSAVAGKMTGELRKQAQHLPDTVKTAGILNAADVLLDMIEGKSDLGTALETAATGTVTGVTIQFVAPIAHEGLKEAVTIVSPQIAENLPCVGSFITAGNALYSFSNAPTTEEGLKNVGYMGAEAVGELAAIAGVTAVTGGTGLPVIIGGKICWRLTKYAGKAAWDWVTSSSSTTIARKVAE